VRANSSVLRVEENTETTQQNCHSKVMEMHGSSFHVFVSFFRWIYIYIYANWLIYQRTYVLSNMHVLRTVYKSIFIVVPMSVLACDTFRFDHLEGKSAVTF